MHSSTDVGVDLCSLLALRTPTNLASFLFAVSPAPFQDRFAYRENMSDVIVQHLVSEQKVRRVVYGSSDQQKLNVMRAGEIDVDAKMAALGALSTAAPTNSGSNSSSSPQRVAPESWFGRGKRNTLATPNLIALGPRMFTTAPTLWWLYGICSLHKLELSPRLSHCFPRYIHIPLTTPCS